MRRVKEEIPYMIVSSPFNKTIVKLHDAINRLRFYPNALIHILSLLNSHNNVASIQKNRDNKSHCVIVALSYNYTMRFIGYNSIQTC